MVSPGPTVSMALNDVPGSAIPVVTEVRAEVGQSIEAGALLGFVSDRPVFAFPLKIPLYRELRSRDSGPDVSSLQAALKVEATGVMDYATLRAIRDLYEAAGSTPPGGNWAGMYVDTDEFYSLPPTDPPASILTLAAVGAVLSSDSPFAVIKTGADRITFRASVAELASIQVGGEARVQSADGTPALGTITSVSDFRDAEGADSATAGYDVIVDLSGLNEPVGMVAGQSVTVTTGEIGEPSMAVPVLAIRSDSQGNYVLRRVLGKPPMRVDVSVDEHVDGWASVLSETLMIGDEVRIAP